MQVLQRYKSFGDIKALILRQNVKSSLAFSAESSCCPWGAQHQGYSSQVHGGMLNQVYRAIYCAATAHPEHLGRGCCQPCTHTQSSSQGLVCEARAVRVWMQRGVDRLLTQPHHPRQAKSAILYPSDLGVLHKGDLTLQK